MKLKTTMILYSILGMISLSFAYVTYVAAHSGNNQDVLAIIFALSVLMGLLFFIPVATGLSLLYSKK